MPVGGKPTVGPYRVGMSGDTSVRLDAVIWEPALLTTVGDEETQQEQLRYLLELGERPNISLQVLPVEAGDHARMSGSFILFSFGNETAVNTVFVENLTSSQYLEKEDELRGYTLASDALRSAALSMAPIRRAHPHPPTRTSSTTRPKPY